MSASREKKSRQSDPTQGLTQKERKELQEQQAAKRKAVVYTVIGVIVAVLVAALLIWHSGIFQRGKTALTVGGRDYSVTDVNYYFTYYMNQAYSTSGGAFDPARISEPSIRTRSRPRATLTSSWTVPLSS